MIKYFILLLAIISTAWAASFDASLAWAHPQSTNMLFSVYGAQGTNAFTSLAIVTNTTSLRLTGLPFNVTNYFYVTARSPVSGLESVPSPTIGYILQLPDAPFSLTITNVRITIP